MNVVALVGNMVREPELKYTQSGKAVLSFTLAVNDEFSKEKKADFIDCVAWEKTAEIIATYTPKGKALGVTGRIKKRQFDGKDGKTVYVTEIIVDRAQLLGGKDETKRQTVNADEFADLTPIDESDIPF